MTKNLKLSGTAQNFHFTWNGYELPMFTFAEACKLVEQSNHRVVNDSSDDEEDNT